MPALLIFLVAITVVVIRYTSHQKKRSSPAHSSPGQQSGRARRPRAQRAAGSQADDGTLRASSYGTAIHKPLDTANHSTAPSVDDHYPGDYQGRLPAHRTYHDGLPRAGAVVHTPIPHRDGRTELGDVVLLGRDGGWLLGARIAYAAPTPDGDGQETPSYNLGRATWNQEHRDAYVLTDRVIRVHPDLIEPRDAHVLGSQLLAVRRQL